MTTRPHKYATYMRIAKELSAQSTCARRRVGCVLVDSNMHIIGDGYNGNAHGMQHCINQPCSGVMSPSGTDLDKCEAIHAEQNALLVCKDINAISMAFVTTFPCMHCIKMLLNTSCFKIVYHEEYAHSTPAQELWYRAGRKTEHQEY